MAVVGVYSEVAVGGKLEVDPLDEPLGNNSVLSHSVVEAAASAAEMWVLVGFADFVMGNLVVGLVLVDVKQVAGIVELVEPLVAAGYQPCLDVAVHLGNFVDP